MRALLVLFLFLLPMVWSSVHTFMRIKTVEGFQCYMQHQPFLWDALDAGFPDHVVNSSSILSIRISQFSSALSAGRPLCGAYDSIIPKPRDKKSCVDRFGAIRAKAKFSRSDPFIQCLRNGEQTALSALQLTYQEERALAANMRTMLIQDQEELMKKK